MANKNFEQFKEKCVEQLSALQDEFMELYDINSYEHWFYDNGMGAFHFNSDDGRNLYFEYIIVGSFSTKRNTWMWSWHNNTVSRHVTKGLQKVKEYGEVNSFQELSQGLIENGDEYTGWTLTAISANLLPAIGSYRIQQEHLFTYFIFTDELTREEYDALKTNIDCDIHGTGRAAFVCQHLLHGSNLGFHEVFESNHVPDSEDDYQAWCDECESAWEKEKEMSEKFLAFTNTKVVCNQCYFEIKRKNQTE